MGRDLDYLAANTQKDAKVVQEGQEAQSNKETFSLVHSSGSTHPTIIVYQERPVIQGQRSGQTHSRTPFKYGED